jgi:hypothetical protein
MTTVRTTLNEEQMLPVGTEVYYDGHYGKVHFACEQYITVCIRTFPDEPSRNVCLVVTPERIDNVTLVNGNRNDEL